MSSRKDFLVTSTALSALAPQIALAASPSPSPSATEAPIPHLDFDVDAFDATLKRPAKHHHLFAAKSSKNGDVFATMRTVVTAYTSYGAQAVDVFPVAVIYHFAIVLAFNDVIWNDVLIPSLSKAPQIMRDDLGTPKAGGGNPYLHKDASDKDDASIEGLIADVKPWFFVCNNALRGFAQQLAKGSGSSAASTYSHIAKNLVPNTTIVPAGVWAVHAVQERGFTLLQVI
jgi:intracellular sulfur oxidation DsrE/DsrF family protein